MIIAHKHSTNVGLSRHYKNGQYCVRIRVTYAGSRTDLYTKLSATPAQWDVKRQRYKQGCNVNGTPYNILNANIDTYINFINDYFNKSSLRESLPSLDEMKRLFNYTFKQSKGKQSDEFFFIFQQYIETRSTTRHWSNEYKKMFLRVCNSLKSFNSEIRFVDFSTETMNRYLQHLAASMYNDKIAKVLSMLKEFMTYANSKNYPVNKEFFEFDPTLPKSHKDVRYLTEDEIKKVINLDLPKGSALDMTRDFFIFQCFTALRYCDLRKLKHENVRETIDGKYVIDILTEKDNDRIPFPLASVATRVYLKYKDNAYDNDVIFPVVSNQKYNNHLKQLGKKANLQGEWIDYQYRIDKVEEVKTPKSDLTSHTARRTFVVLALNRGIQLDLIAQITSHSDIKAMQPYIAATQLGKQQVIDAIDNVSKNW